MYTTIPYLYRDTANYKEGSDIVLQGALSAEDIAAIKAKLFEGTSFIPHDLSGLGIAELQPRMPGYPSEDDHVWHELQLGHVTTSDSVEDGQCVVPAEAFKTAFACIENADGWDICSAVERLDV